MYRKFTEFIMTSKGAEPNREMLEQAFVHISNEPRSPAVGKLKILEMHATFSDGMYLTAVRFRPEQTRRVLDAMLAHVNTLPDKITPTPIPGFEHSIMTGADIDCSLGDLIRYQIRSLPTRNSFYAASGPIKKDMLHGKPRDSGDCELTFDFPQIDGMAHPDMPLPPTEPEPEEEEEIITEPATRRRRVRNDSDDEPVFPTRPEDDIAPELNWKPRVRK